MKELGFFHKNRHRSYTHFCLYVVERERADLFSLLTVMFLDKAESLSKELLSKSSELVSLSQNLVDAIWEDRPTRPASLVFHLDEKYSGTVTPPFFKFSSSDHEIKDNRMWIKSHKCGKSFKRRRPRLLWLRCWMKWHGCSTCEVQTSISTQVSLGMGRVYLSDTHSPSSFFRICCDNHRKSCTVYQTGTVERCCKTVFRRSR